MQSHRFRDFEAFAASVRGVDCRMMMQNPSDRSWDIDGVDLGGIQAQQGRLGSGNIVEGHLLADNVMLYLPLSDDCEYAANGTPVGTNSVAILEPGCELCVSTKFAHDWCTIVFPTSLFAGGYERKMNRVTASNPELASHFRKSVREIITSASACLQFESAAAARSAAATLKQVASAVIGQPLAIETPREGRPKIPRKDIIGRAMMLLESRRDEPVLVGELATAAGVSERTLETAFVEYFGTGPVRYLQLRQLHQVSHALKAADPDTTLVTDVLVQNGVWQWGRFAARYRKFFGELPSEALRSGRQRR